MQFVFMAMTGSMLAVAILFLRPPRSSGRAAARLPLFLPMFFPPVIAIGGYLLLGTPQAIDVGSHDRQPPVSRLISGLEARLTANPDDQGGWLLLAKSYRHLGMVPQAQAAIARAEAIDAASRRPARHETHGMRMRGHVALAPALVDRVDPDDTVFVFAKESRSQRMPVAAMRRSARDLPFDFELTDTNAMIAGTQLGDFESLLVTARVSPTGRAADSASVFETWSQPVLPGDNTFIDLVIADKAVPKESNNE
jgi:hypothetical protein